MRCVAESAILTDWGVFPQVGAAFLGVTLITCVIQRNSGRLSGHRIVVHAVTCAAYHLSFAHRMRERLAHFISYWLVASRTDLRLGFGLRDSVPACMTLMTIGAAHILETVRARMPADAHVSCMAVQAHSVLNLDRCIVTSIEIDQRRSFLASAHTARMSAAWTMTGFALQLAMAKRATGV